MGLGFGIREGSPQCLPAALPYLLALAGYEVADPHQTGPHAFMVVVLAGTRMSQLPARDSVPGPVSPLHLVLCPQEVDHTVQDLCLLHLWILQILDKREKQCTDHSPSQQPGVRNVSRIQTKTGA